MLDLPNCSVLDKDSLLGGCVKLPIAIDAARLLDEYRKLPEALWGTRGGRVGVHNAAEAVFLRGYAPAEGELPIEDRPALQHLPYVRHLIKETIPAPVYRCLLAKLPASAVVAPHIDRAPYFSKTLRIHIPIETHSGAWMMCANKYYAMRAGECWVINNSTLHGVWNADRSRPRTHMICDFSASPALLDIVAAGEKDLALDAAPANLPW